MERAAPQGSEGMPLVSALATGLVSSARWGIQTSPSPEPRSDHACQTKDHSSPEPSRLEPLPTPGSDRAGTSCATLTVLHFNPKNIRLQHADGCATIELMEVDEVVVVLPQRTHPEHEEDSFVTLNFHPRLQATLRVITTYSRHQINPGNNTRSLPQVNEITINEFTIKCAKTRTCNVKRLVISILPNMVLWGSFGGANAVLLNEETFQPSAYALNPFKVGHWYAADPARDADGFVLPAYAAQKSPLESSRGVCPRSSNANVNVENFALTATTAFEFHLSSGRRADEDCSLPRATSKRNSSPATPAGTLTISKQRCRDKLGPSIQRTQNEDPNRDLSTGHLSSSPSGSELSEHLSPPLPSLPGRQGPKYPTLARHGSAPIPGQKTLHDERGPDGKFVPKSISSVAQSQARREQRSVSFSASLQRHSEARRDSMAKAEEGRRRQSSTGRRKSGLEAEIEALFYAHNKYPDRKSPSPPPVRARTTRTPGRYAM